MKISIKQDLSQNGQSKLCIAAQGNTLFTARVNPDTQEVAKEWEIAQKLHQLHPIGFNRPITLDGQIALYPKLNGLGAVYKTKAGNYKPMLKSFIVQIICIFGVIYDADLRIGTKISNKDIGIEYGDTNVINILGQKIETYGSIYKLLNYEIIKEGRSDVPMINLFRLFLLYNTEIPDNYEQILEAVIKKKYVAKLETDSPNLLVQFWIYMIFHPKVLGREIGKDIRITKYLDDDDYIMIANFIDDSKKLAKYFAEK